MILSYKQIDSNSNMTIKEILKSHFEISDRLLTRLKQKKKIFVNEKSILSINQVLNKNEILTVDISWEENNSNIVPTKMDLDIIYEDEAYLVINKPAGIAIHPSILHFEDSLSNGIRFYFDQIGLKKKVRIVNRLDRDTSGLVIVAKNEYIQECLVKQMIKKQIVKKYIGFIEYSFEKLSGTIDAPIGRKENSIIEREVTINGDKSITHYRVLQKENSFSVVEFLLETGRTHQIRVHSAYLGSPLLGDTLYGHPSNLITRHALHSYFLSFTHPITKKQVSYESDLPKDMKKLLTN